jgi:hypothetical protein
VQSRVNQHTGMSHTQDETITVRPNGIFRVKTEKLGPNGVGNGCHGHGSSRVTRVCLLDTIHGKTTNGIYHRLFFLGPDIVKDVGVLGGMDDVGCTGRVDAGHGVDVLMLMGILYLYLLKKSKIQDCVPLITMICLRIQSLFTRLFSAVLKRISQDCSCRILITAQAEDFKKIPRKMESSYSRKQRA